MTAAPAPEFSVVIPVFREREAINGLIGHLRGLDAPGPVEIIVVDGEEEASTLREIAHNGIAAVNAPRGRALQMNEGARVAKGRILIFLHADTFLPADAFHVVHGFMNDHGIAAGAFDLGFDSDRFALRLIARAGSLRSRITSVPFGDQAVFMRREYFDSLGGYREIPLMEDVDLMRRIRRCGGRIAISPSRVRTSARKWEREGVWITTLRNYFIQVSYLLGVSPERLHGLYYRQNRKPGLPL